MLQRPRRRSPASRRGTSRWRSSPARSRRRLPPATPCWPSPPSRRRSPPSSPRSMLHEAGVPGDVLHLLPGSGRLGEALVKDPRVKGVAFTGSNETGVGDPEGARRPAQRHRAVHRRDRRHQRHDRRLRARCPSRSCATRCARPSTAPASAARRRACSSCRRMRPDRTDRHAGRRHRGARYRRPVRLRDRHRPRDRRGGAGRARRPQDAHAARRAPARRPAAARELPRRHLRDARRLRDRPPGDARARGVRPDPARGALRARRARQGGRRHQRLAATA